MTPEQALQNLQAVLKQIRATAEEHAVLRQSLEVLGEQVNQLKKMRMETLKPPPKEKDTSSNT